jgi:hypothetical protein
LPAFAIPVIIVLGVAVLLGVAALLVSGFRRRRLVKALQAQHAAQVAKLERCTSAASSMATLRHSMHFITFKNLRRAGRILPYEQARNLGLLMHVDTFDEITPFCGKHPTIFVSHQWLDAETPDPRNEHFEALCAAVTALCERHPGLQADELAVWFDYVAPRESNSHTRSRASCEAAR